MVSQPFALGDLVQMRKSHPCGSDQWIIIRVGADIKIKCQGCGRIVMLDRAVFEKRLKKVLAPATTENPQNTAGEEP